MLYQDRPAKNSAKCLLGSGEIPIPPQTSIDETDDCVMKSEPRALIRGSDPPSGRRVHITAGGSWRAPARRLIQMHLGAHVLKTEDKNSRSLSNGKK